MARVTPMVEVVFALHPVVDKRTGRLYQSNVVGVPAADGHWNAWIEFPDGETGAILRTTTETHQERRSDLNHWSSARSDLYLEDALARAIAARAGNRSTRGPVRRAKVPGRCVKPALNPFELFTKGEQVLRRELQRYKAAALRTWIVRHDLNPGGLDLVALSKTQLVALMVEATRARCRLIAQCAG